MCESYFFIFYDNRLRETKGGVGVMRDKKLKLEDLKDSLTLGGLI